MQLNPDSHHFKRITHLLKIHPDYLRIPSIETTYSELCDRERTKLLEYLANPVLVSERFEYVNSSLSEKYVYALAPRESHSADLNGICINCDLSVRKIPILALLSGRYSYDDPKITPAVYSYEGTFKDTKLDLESIMIINPKGLFTTFKINWQINE